MTAPVIPQRKSRIEFATDMYEITPSDSDEIPPSVITTNSPDPVLVKVTTVAGNDVTMLLRGGIPSLCAVKKVYETGGDSLSGITVLGIPYDCY